MTDVPAQVQYQNHVQSGIQVRGGNNYDLSRTATTTPLTRILVIEPTPIPAPEPKNLSATPYQAKDGVPQAEPALTVTFGKNSAVLSPGAVTVKSARALRGKSVVVGHADSGETDPAQLATARAEAVAKALRKYGAKPQVKSFAADREVTDQPESRERNRRVEAFKAEK